MFPAIAVAEELCRRAADLRIGIVASEKEIDRSILTLSLIHISEPTRPY